MRLRRILGRLLKLSRLSVLPIVIFLSGQFALKWLITTDPAKVKLLNSSFSFEWNPGKISLFVKQDLMYEVSASEPVSELKVTARFERYTKILNCNIVGEINQQDCVPKKNLVRFLNLPLLENLDPTKTAMIYLQTKNPVKSPEDKPDKPEVHINGKRKNGNSFHN